MIFDDLTKINAKNETVQIQISTDQPEDVNLDNESAIDEHIAKDLRMELLANNNVERRRDNQVNK